MSARLDLPSTSDSRNPARWSSESDTRRSMGIASLGTLKDPFEDRQPRGLVVVVRERVRFAEQIEVRVLLRLNLDRGLVPRRLS